MTFSAYTDRADFRLAEGFIVYENRPVLRLAETKLRGSHNIENLMATLAAGMARGLPFEKMVSPLCAYEPRPHRCEFVRQIGGVDYINDSKATNLDALEKALLAQNKPVILIAGGKDKGFSFEPLCHLVEEKVRSTILIGEMAERIARDWSGALKTELASSLADAVEQAHAAAKPGEVVDTWVGLSNQSDAPMSLSVRLATLTARDDGHFDVEDAPDPAWASSVEFRTQVDLRARGYVKAPVKIRMDSPARSGRDGSASAMIRPTTASSTGSPRVSPARTA